MKYIIRRPEAFSHSLIPLIDTATLRVPPLGVSQ